MVYSKFQDFYFKVLKLQERKFVRYGVPFFLLVVGASFGLKQFTSVRYEYRDSTLLDPKVFEAEGIKMKKPGEVTLESEYEKIAKVDLDNWENIRGPRPYENNTEFEEVVKKQKEEKEKRKMNKLSDSNATL